MRLTTCLRFLAAALAIAIAGSAGAQVPTAMTTQAHNYKVKDGVQYGYPRALSADDQAAGRIAQSVIMFRYAGERNGKYQVHASDGMVFTALECEKPCQVVKVMTFLDADMMRDTVRVENLVFQPGTIAAAVFQDVFNGQLHPYGMERGTKRFQVWVDDKGRREFAIAAKK